MDSWDNSQPTPTGDRQLHRRRWRLALRGRPRLSLLSSTRPATTSLPRQRQLLRPQSDHADQPAHGRRHPARARLCTVVGSKTWPGFAHCLAKTRGTLRNLTLQSTGFYSPPDCKMIVFQELDVAPSSRLCRGT
ncbi:uncharacterized protein LOC142775821 [Rhipicephalus microplus]|uniref:uncharacterized protein LOC142775821 n=1 Tax=Rhipicephalus microplus TaxID=6941 RepID=UPI003F6ABD87